jgi:hypothetical protein
LDGWRLAKPREALETSIAAATTARALESLTQGNNGFAALSANCEPCDDRTEYDCGTDRGCLELMRALVGPAIPHTSGCKFKRKYQLLIARLLRSCFGLGNFKRRQRLLQRLDTRKWAKPLGVLELIDPTRQTPYGHASRSASLILVMQAARLKLSFG